MHQAGRRSHGTGSAQLAAFGSGASADTADSTTGSGSPPRVTAGSVSMTGTHQGPFAGVEATGKAIRSESMAFYRLSHGKIVEERAQLDMLGILRQMGALPTA